MAFTLVKKPEENLKINLKKLELYEGSFTYVLKSDHLVNLGNPSAYQGFLEVIDPEISGDILIINEEIKKILGEDFDEISKKDKKISEKEFLKKYGNYTLLGLISFTGGATARMLGMSEPVIRNKDKPLSKVVK